jgi:hypothetical protein
MENSNENAGGYSFSFFAQGTRAVLIDDTHQGHLYNPVNDQVSKTRHFCAVL